MKGGKDEEKAMGPLFPRLHVNDTDKGGPRAPPRNKMALYEQLSAPSHRYNSMSLAALPLPPHNTSNLVPPAPSNQGGVHERRVISPMYIPSSMPAHSVENHHSRSLDGRNSEFERTSAKTGSCKAPNASGPLMSTSECNSKGLHDYSNPKSSSGKKSNDEDDFCVPTYKNGAERGDLNSVAMCSETSTDITLKGSQKSTRANCKSLIQLENAADRPLGLNNSFEIRSKGRNINGAKQVHPSVVEDITKMPNHVNVSLVGNNLSAQTNNCENSIGLLSENNTDANGVSVEAWYLNSKNSAKNVNTLKVRSESVPRALLGNCHRSNGFIENRVNGSEGKAWLGSVDGNDDESETSMVDSLSGLDISPDDVVGVIGQEHFWKARKAIVNQQRIFAVQVFELHRLIKVQKLFAGSPDMLLENNPFLSRPPPRVPTRKPTSEYSLKYRSQMIQKKNDSQKPSQTHEWPSLNEGSPKTSLPNHGNCVERELVSQKPNCGPHSGNTLPPSPAPDNHPNPWCFHPPGNQWLVPIMSASEGLVYKPVMAPCPPNVGFMTPFYGGCGPISVPPTVGYGVPASHQQPGVGVFPGSPMVAQNYFPPAYGLPVMNSMVPTPVDQMKTSAGSQPDQQAKQVSTRNVNFNMHSKSSCNMSNQKSEALSGCKQNFQTSKDTEVQGSSGSSPCEEAQGAGHVVEDRQGENALSFFPVGPAIDVSNPSPQIHSGEQPTRVIKVVPHNPRSASESAARIFRSIQKEREQYDSL